jgi:mannose-1-phosphate guanylyltransferase
MLHALIMAGGGGTRFWPRSRAARPKQFLTLTGDRSLLQQAADRIEGPIPAERTWVFTAGRHRDEVLRQLPHVPAPRVVGEPAGRDTAACIGLAAGLMAAEDPDATMLVMPADHVIEPPEAFRRAIQAAALAVDADPAALVTFGITPTYAATGFGYIRRGERVAEFAGLAVHRVDAFREKPAASVAAEYVAAGGYFWNAGIFVWRAATLLAELRRTKPELVAEIDRIVAAWPTPERDRVLAQIYPTLEKTSIDYAVMEKAPRALMLAAPFHWDDVGSWPALERLHAQDPAGNTVQARHAGIDTANCIIVGGHGLLIATAGVRDLLIVHDGDALLVANRHDEAAVKKLVEHLAATGREEFL